MRRIGLLAMPLAFAAGLLADRAMLPAHAADAALSPQIIDLAAMTDEAIGPVQPNGLRGHGLVTTTSGTIAIQSGNIVKHTHSNADEIQYVIAGSGTFWLGDTQREIHPGDLIVIPKGIPHAGSVNVGGVPIRTIAIKLPPQASDDFHPM